MSGRKRVSLIVGAFIVIGGVAAASIITTHKSSQRAQAEQSQSSTLGEAVYRQTQIAFETIPFDKQTVEDSSMPVNSTQITTKGYNGTQTVTYELIYNQNGDLIEKKVIKTEITKKSVTEIIKVGTLSRVSSAPQVQGTSTQPEEEPTPVPEPEPICTDGFYSNTYSHCVPTGKTGMCIVGGYTTKPKSTACGSINNIKEWYL